MKSKLLFLTLTSFSETGGIQSVCKTLAHALQELQMLALYDQEPDTRYIPEQQFKGYAGQKLKFMLQCLCSGFRANTVILSHINLILFAVLIKLINRKVHLILLAHGTEVDRAMSSWKIKFINRFISIWAVSTHTSNILQNRHHIHYQRINILNNCLDPFFNVPNDFQKPAHLLERHRIKAAAPIIFSLCRMTATDAAKGYDFILRSMPDLLREHQDLQYLMAGKMSPSEQQRLLKLIHRLRLQNHVKLIGFIPEAELSNYYQLADVFVLPSKKEGFGLVFIEAAACGCPVIAGHADGSSDALLNGTLGTLVDPNKPWDLTLAISAQLNTPKSNTQAKALQTICLAHFNFQKYSHKVNQLLS